MTEITATISEIFRSIEGEGPYTGWPTIYVRFSGCNFTCAGFNNPNNLPISNEVLGFNPADYKTLTELPPITIGCDSIYSWDNRFKHMWETLTIDQLAARIVALLPNGKWLHPRTNQPYILSLTGGEPTLRHKQIEALLEHPLLKDLQVLLIETNGSVPLHKKLITALHYWTGKSFNNTLIWSNSPKLSASGEPWDKAIKPEVYEQQWLPMMGTISSRITQYFKFVCGDSDDHFAEVDRFITEVRDDIVKSIPVWENIYIMPMSCVTDQQDNIAAKVAQRCIDNGYIYCHRVHLDVFDNSVGT